MSNWFDSYGKKMQKEAAEMKMNKLLDEAVNDVEEAETEFSGKWGKKVFPRSRGRKFKTL